MAETVVFVEAWDEVNEVWKNVTGKTLAGEEEDIMGEAEAIRQTWLDGGWPEKDIRISKSKFREFGKTWRSE